MPPAKPFLPRKLLIAAVGAASINVLGTACGGAVEGSSFDDADAAFPDPPTSGNLASSTVDAAPQMDAAPPTSGNLAAPIDAGTLDAADASEDDGG